ncbi:MAG: flagellar basal body L-ring protein FlgH [Candidatus Acidiferrales bacterium]|jgi:flagellar L-ring protein precursor FlgH
MQCSRTAPHFASRGDISRNLRTLFTAAALLLSVGMSFAARPCAAQVQKLKKMLKPSNQSDPLEQYLKAARVAGIVNEPTTGSLWRSNGTMADMASDDKARYLGDEITIQLAESTTSAQQGSVQTARTMSASSGVAAFFGLSNPAATNLFSPSSTQTLAGKGQTSLTTSLITTIGANVVEVLPDGLLVIEAQRQVRVTDQNETIVLRGIVRRSDLSPTNVVLSTSISHLEVNVVGKGVITEGTHPPNPIIRIMLRVLGF